MAIIPARIAVAADGTTLGHASARIPAGEHVARISVVDQVSGLTNDGSELPSTDLGPWPEAMS